MTLRAALVRDWIPLVASIAVAAVTIAYPLAAVGLTVVACWWFWRAGGPDEAGTL